MPHQLGQVRSQSLYQSRSEAIRDAVRTLVERRYVSKIRFLKVIAQISAQVVLSAHSDTVTDIILYGSVATERVSEDSDIDILILVSIKGHETAGQLEIRIHEITYPIALASGSVITPIVLEKRRFLALWRIGEHFAKEVVRHGIPLHGMILHELREQTVPPKG